VKLTVLTCMNKTEHQYEFVTESPISMAKKFLSSSPEVDKPDIASKKPRSHKHAVAAIDAKEENEDEEFKSVGERIPKKKTKMNVNVKEMVKVKEKPKKPKPKHKTDVFEDDKEDNDGKPLKIVTIHILIESTTPSGPSKLHTKATSLTIKTLQCRPFFHDMADDFNTLLCSIAKITPCAVESLVATKLQWKSETPLGGLCKLLANDVGYGAMISGVKGRKGDVAVFVYIPPPAKSKVVSETHHICYVLPTFQIQTWPTSNPHHVMDPLDFEEEMAEQELRNMSHKAQIVHLYFLYSQLNPISRVGHNAPWICTAP
jgi:hypothetical protein